MKSCDNCYWKGMYSQSKKMYNQFLCSKTGQIASKVCEKYQSMCKECSSCAGYDYKGKKYCFDCLLNELEVESYEVTHYTLNGEYLASEDDIEQILLEKNKNIKIIERDNGGIENERN